jgi:hypothetical protein
MPNPSSTSGADRGRAIQPAGRRERAELLRRADRELTASNMQPYAAAARMRLGELERGTSGELRIAQTQALGVAAPERWTRMCALGSDPVTIATWSAAREWRSIAPIVTGVPTVVGRWRA